MSKEISAQAFTDAQAFIKTHGAGDEGGSEHTITKGQYYDFYKQNGVDRAVLDQVQEVKQTLIGGAVQAATANLDARIKAAKEAGDDPIGYRQEVRIATPTGRINVEITAQRTSKNPATGEAVIKHGGVRVSEKYSKASIPKGPAADAAATIAKAMGVQG